MYVQSFFYMNFTSMNILQQYEIVIIELSELQNSDLQSRGTLDGSTFFSESLVLVPFFSSFLPCLFSPTLDILTLTLLKYSGYKSIYLIFFSSFLQGVYDGKVCQIKNIVKTVIEGIILLNHSSYAKDS